MPRYLGAFVGVAALAVFCSACLELPEKEEGTEGKTPPEVEEGPGEPDRSERTPPVPGSVPRAHAAREAMIANGTLGDGMSVEQAAAVIGPPSSQDANNVEWYDNPGDRLHVAPFFRATKRGNGLYEWKTGMR
jgi:hypothetical protein